MICNLLLVGTELLVGQIDDTNSSYIARKLLDAGINSYEHRRIGDNEQRITDAIKDLLETSDCVIVTGGLGPTHDDITREVVAKVMGVELEYNVEIENKIREKFQKRNLEMPRNNIRQAMVPQNATTIENKTGTAPGLMCPVKDKWLYLVPGVPHEMKPMINDHVIPHIQSLGKTQSIVMRTIKTWGTTESQLAELLNEYVQKGESSDVKVGFLARGINGIYVKLSASGENKQKAISLIKPVEKQVLETLGDLAYGFDEETMESVVVELLKQRKLSLSVAESLTGGMLSSRLVEVNGVSDILKGSVVTYATESKSKVLNVITNDVYSTDCAIQMAQGVKQALSTDVAIATTGVAGPKADNGHRPGEVYIGISTPKSSFAKKYELGGDRLRVRQYTSICALNLLRLWLIGVDPGADDIRDSD